uniref:Presenilin n=1 Tax=Kalanchoe fedtschenkoi TaxID=63787 RepID=A0A7N0T1M4_KALFE
MPSTVPAFDLISDFDQTNNTRALTQRSRLSESAIHTHQPHIQILPQFELRLAQSSIPKPLSMDPTRRPKSLIDSLGEEIVRIITPVSVCMFLVVILVSILNSSSSTPSVSSIATIAYSESGSDSSWDKLKGALLNAVVFVAVVTVVTFVLVLLFYLRCTKFLKIYMGFSACIVLGFMGGEMALVLVSRFSLPVDCVTFGILLFNFTVVGALAVFMSKMAILVTQAYLVVIGMLVAYWFTMLPEWTTWALLIAMSLYDLAAVLLPGGPLRLLVELAMSRDEDIPALVYEARPVTSDTDGAMLRRRVWRSNVESDHTSDDSMSAANSTAFSNTNPENSLYTGVRQSESGLENVEAGLVLGREAELSAPLIERRITIQSTERERQEAGSNYDLALEGIGLGSSGAIKLGLGDFIFYSVLVGRAAMYDFMTVYACYLAIIAGLGVTLMLLAVYQKALPALPVSVLLALHFNLVYHYLWQISAFNTGLYPSLAISERLKVDSSDEILSAIFVKLWTLHMAMGLGERILREPLI